MKLYQLSRGDYFRLSGDDEVFRLVRIDGMYSIVTDSAGRVFNFAAFTEVVPVKENV